MRVYDIYKEHLMNKNIKPPTGIFHWLSGDIFDITVYTMIIFTYVIYPYIGKKYM